MSPPHLAYIESINCICPGCGVKFGYVIENEAVKCPLCRFVQPLPIVKIGSDMYYCIPCDAKRMALSTATATCINCGKRPQWIDPQLTTGAGESNLPLQT